MRLFVTGGAGFIGSNFARRAIERGTEVTVYDSLTYAGNVENFADIKDHEGFRFVEGDICDGETMKAAMAGER